jgi:hypothetical protein
LKFQPVGSSRRIQQLEMSCPNCSDLLPVHLYSLRAGQRATMFILLSDLRNSATTTSCASCKLLLGALSLYKKDHQEGDDGNFLELRLAVGEHLQLYWRREPVIYIEIFTRDGDHSLDPSSALQCSYMGFQLTRALCLQPLEKL